MSDIAMPAAVNTYRHAPWCSEPTIVDDEGRASCVNDGGTCGKNVGDVCAILVDSHGNTMVSAEVTVDLMTPQEALAIGLEFVRTAMLADARVL